MRNQEQSLNRPFPPFPGALRTVGYGNEVLVCATTQGLINFDLHDSLSPQVCSRLLIDAKWLFVQEKLLFAVSRKEIQAVDYTDPVNPAVLGQCPLLGIPKRVTAEGATVCVAEHHRPDSRDKASSVFVEIFDVSDPSAIHPVSTCPHSEIESDILLRDNYLFGGRGVYNLANPRVPVRVGEGCLSYDRLIAHEHYIIGLNTTQWQCYEFPEFFLDAHSPTKLTNFSVFREIAAISGDFSSLSIKNQVAHMTRIYLTNPKDLDPENSPALVMVSLSDPLNLAFIAEWKLDHTSDDSLFVEDHLCIYNRKRLRLYEVGTLEPPRELWRIDFAEK